MATDEQGRWFSLAREALVVTGYAAVPGVILGTLAGLRAWVATRADPSWAAGVQRFLLVPIEVATGLSVAGVVWAVVALFRAWERRQGTQRA